MSPLQKKFTSFFVFLFLIFFRSPAQDLKVIDSLLNRIEKDYSSTEVVDAYLKVALEYSGLDSLNSHKYISLAMNLADSLHYQEGKANALYVQSRNSMLRGDYRLADKDLNSLKDLSEEINYPEGKANSLFGFAWLSYYRGNYEESIDLHMKSLEIRRTLDLQQDVSSSLRGIGITYKLLGQFDKSLDYLQRSLEIEISINNKSGIAECLNHIGIIDGLRGNYASALDSYFQALDIQEEISDKSGLAYTHQNIGVIYYQQGDYSKTLDSYNESLRLREEIGETRGIAQLTFNMGVVYHDQNMYEEALEYYLEGLKMKAILGDRRGVADGYLNIGKLFADQDLYSEAVENQQVSLKIAREINSNWGKVNALVALGTSYFRLEQYIRSRNNLLEGIELAKEAKLVESLREAAGVLSMVEKELGDYRAAYEAQLLYQQISDSLSNEVVTKEITRLATEYEFNQVKDSIQFANEREKLILDQKIRAQRNTQWISITTVIVLVIVIAILYRYYRLKQTSNLQLAQKNQEIQENNELLTSLNTEKNNLIGIVAHDLKNPLSNIIGAVNLIDTLEPGEEEPELIDVIRDSSARMLNMITEILNVESIEENIKEVHVKAHDISSSTHDVCDQLAGKASAKQISIKRSIEKNLLGMVDPLFFSQVVENLISNAIKFSPNGKEIDIHLSNKQNKMLLEVKDEGPGITESDMKRLFYRFQRLSAKPTGQESSTGLGLSIVKQFVDKMGGRVWAESVPGEGASFFVEVKSS